jgi:F-type H+-transporting ATPase subunit b
MEQIFIQLQGILVMALPAFFLVLILHFYLKRVLFQPMERVLEERRRRTEGALEGSEEAVRAAEARMHAYEAKLAEARAAIYVESEAARKQLAEQQAAGLAEARATAAARLAKARAAIADESILARAALTGEAEQLAARITSAVLGGRMQ